MGVEKVVLKEGNGLDIPKKHDEVSIEYTGSSNSSRAKLHVSPNLQVGCLTRQQRITKATSAYERSHSRADLFYLRFDSSVGRGDLITPIGVGRVIRGPFTPSSTSYMISSQAATYAPKCANGLTLLHRLG
ncbi:hypothetical protein N0V83_010112 [Neocucurbitaria cava]|uniref:Uncharacterized protein n=1 Tax=Neocucurbitaria cava TaxID=798079 RepID=A0A9W9CGV6_9PLEO|nr:hypothetical protein N0V83_010112 [Neocucurbitaria cava]